MWRWGYVHPRWRLGHPGHPEAGAPGSSNTRSLTDRWTDRVRGQANLHDAAGGRQSRHHERRARPGRQCGGDLRHTLLHQLTAFSSSAPVRRSTGSRTAGPPTWTAARLGLQYRSTDPRSVINSSTSSEELLSAMVWISTLGGANSGRRRPSYRGVEAQSQNGRGQNSNIQRNRRLSLTGWKRISQPPLSANPRFRVLCPRARSRQQLPLRCLPRARAQNQQAVPAHPLIPTAART